jgi:hypothetical protein
VLAQYGKHGLDRRTRLNVDDRSAGRRRNRRGPWTDDLLSVDPERASGQRSDFPGSAPEHGRRSARALIHIFASPFSITASPIRARVIASDRAFDRWSNSAAISCSFSAPAAARSTSSNKDPSSSSAATSAPNVGRRSSFSPPTSLDASPR